VRKIKPSQILSFFVLFSVVVALGLATTALTVGQLSLGDFRGVVMVAAAILFVYLYGFAIYRLFLWIAPLPEGEIAPESRAEFVYHIYILFYLILFYPLLGSGTVPVPLMRLVYLALGARLGTNTYSSGQILDPPFVHIGSNSVVGLYAVLIPHVIEGSRLAHHTIRIGDNVTIGAHAVVLSGVTIGNNAIIATGAVVQKNTVIGEGEVWGGVPARLLQKREASMSGHQLQV
jgi:acetyltransferase-like isoleucine patch superfamily enzyme